MGISEVKAGGDILSHFNGKVKVKYLIRVSLIKHKRNLHKNLAVWGRPDTKGKINVRSQVKRSLSFFPLLLLFNMFHMGDN
jgi:hypothetical protein